MMRICPECDAALGTDPLHCSSCGWRGDIRDGVEIALSRVDGANALLRDYYENYDKIAADDLDSGILDERYVVNQADNLLDKVRRAKGALVCDLGCGQGHLARGLLARGAAEVTCVDISMAYLKRLAPLDGIRAVLANAERLPFRDHFDIVVTTDVMEHVLNVGSFLFCLNRALKTGGCAYIRVPYKESLLGYSPHRGCPYDFVHLRSFDEAILKSYLKAANFTVEALDLDGFVLGTPRDYWMRTEKRRQRYEAFKRLTGFLTRHPADVTRWPSGFASKFMRAQEIVVTARKKGDIQ